MLYLALETSTRNCSVALFNGARLLAIKEEHSDQYIHSEKLHLFIESLMAEAGFKMADLEGIAVGAGPGSYTGLRIGVASAKALAYALQIPLVSALGTELLVQEVLGSSTIDEGATLLPMIDARRMEVYTASYHLKNKQWSEVEAKIIDENSFSDLEGPIYYFGDGAAKCQEVLNQAKFHFLDLPFPSAKAFGSLAPDLFESGKTVDIAYFEPFYLKSFQAIKPKKLI